MAEHHSGDTSRSRENLSEPPRSDLLPVEAFEGTIRAAWVFTGDRLERGGAIRIVGGRVAEVLECATGDEVDLDFPDGLVHPGLVNAHCHLDLTNLAGRVPAGNSFVDWLGRVRATRLDSDDDSLVAASRAGLAELTASGVTAVIDFSHASASLEAFTDRPIRGLLLRELLGFTEARARPALREAQTWLAARQDLGQLGFGLAPHAPYSASGDLIRSAKALCGTTRPVSIHVAEDPAESTFLKDGSGPYREFLLSLGLSLDEYTPSGRSPIGYLDWLGALDEQTLLIHANTVDGDDIERIRRSGAAVVFCPGTHAFFGRPQHRLPELLEAGVPVGLGTDSSASNSELSVASEMRAVRRSFPERRYPRLSSAVIWGLGTGVWLRRFLPAVGRLEAGDRADVAVARVGEREGRPLERFLEDDGVENLLTLCGGHRYIE